METCHYETVETSEREVGDNVISRKYLLRQVLICSGIWVTYFCAGLSFGSPTVFIPQIRREANSSDAISIEMESWLTSTFNYSAAVSAVILAILARLIGRKFTFMTICATALTGYIVLYYSTNTTHIILSEIIHGPLVACPVTISYMVLTEYTSPRYRGVFLTLKSATFFWGVWVANTIGTFFHWKNIGIIAFICIVYTLLTVLFWPESPYWLVNKNKLEDGAASHRWLKGSSRESEAELEILLQLRKTVKSTQGKSVNFFKKIGQIFTTKIIYKPVILSMLVLTLYHFSGKIACAMYAIDIIKRITGTESTAYTGMIILDGITVLGMYVGCGISRFLKRRTYLLVSTTIGVSFLFCISFYLYLTHFGIISENTFISMSLLIGYTLTLSVGPMLMCTTILCELIPVKYRSFIILVVGCFTNFLSAGIMKTVPFILQHFGVRGLFLFFSVNETIFIIINYKVLPETKDKTILEIQEILLGTKSNTKMTGNLIEPN